MNQLNALDSHNVRVIVGNAYDSMSSSACNTSDFFQYTPASSSSSRAGWRGLSVLLSGTTSNGESQTVLLNAGADPKLWEFNAAAMQVDVGNIEAAVLSHYQYDPSGVCMAPSVSFRRFEDHLKDLSP